MGISWYCVGYRAFYQEIATPYGLAMTNSEACCVKPISIFCILHSAFPNKKSALSGGFFVGIGYTLLGAGMGSESLRILASAIRCLGHTVAHRPQETHLE